MNNTRKTRRAEHQECRLRRAHAQRAAAAQARGRPRPPAGADADRKLLVTKISVSEPFQPKLALLLLRLTGGGERKRRTREGRRDEMSSYMTTSETSWAESGTSRADVLRAVAAYIEEFSARPTVADISRQNRLLEEQITRLRRKLPSQCLQTRRTTTRDHRRVVPKDKTANRKRKLRLNARAESSPGGRAKERTKSGSISGRGADLVRSVSDCTEDIEAGRPLPTSMTLEDEDAKSKAHTRAERCKWHCPRRNRPVAPDDWATLTRRLLQRLFC
ncbi:hypothetical protein EVAR_96391_1 [Eumeta japonica]|uniref:Uncharacterized protein n=1 Tax=Eumeta variegata TaxID=151549 RepID=A0A4C1WBC4_EUMVA|nr:hypothetical protein EVAR_96391_1 [Eumeta japonica]